MLTDANDQAEAANDLADEDYQSQNEWYVPMIDLCYQVYVVRAYELTKQHDIFIIAQLRCMGMTQVRRRQLDYGYDTGTPYRI